MQETKELNHMINGLFITDQNQETTILTKCYYNYSPNFSVVSYNESQKTELENIMTVIKIYNNKKIIINRQNNLNNNLNNNLIIEKNVRNECKYKTPFGVILMGTTGEFLETNLFKDFAEIYFSYKIDFNNYYSHINQVKIKITKYK